jgi:hypothetical protein
MIASFRITAQPVIFDAVIFDSNLMVVPASADTTVTIRGGQKRG